MLPPLAYFGSVALPSFVTIGWPSPVGTGCSVPENCPHKADALLSHLQQVSVSIRLSTPGPLPQHDELRVGVFPASMPTRFSRSATPSLKNPQFWQAGRPPRHSGPPLSSHPHRSEAAPPQAPERPASGPGHSVLGGQCSGGHSVLGGQCSGGIVFWGDNVRGGHSVLGGQCSGGA